MCVVCVLEWGGDSTCRQISCEPSETADSFTSMCTQLTELKGGDLIYPDLFMSVFQAAYLTFEPREGESGPTLMSSNHLVDLIMMYVELVSAIVAKMFPHSVFARCSHTSGISFLV